MNFITRAISRVKRVVVYSKYSPFGWIAICLFILSLTVNLSSNAAQRLIYGIQQEPDILNPIISNMFYTSVVSNLVYSGLVKINDKMEVIPDLTVEVPTLENGGISEDYLTYTYHLRRDVKWHDGHPFTSKDVEFTYQTIMNPDINVVSTQGYDKIETVKTPDDYTVVFHLKEVFAPFVLNFTVILPEHILKDVPGKDFQKNEYNRMPVGTGPFKITRWVSASHLVFQAYEDYFLGKPGLDEIILKVIPNENTLFVQLQTGEIHGFDGANTTQHKRLSRLPGVIISVTEALAWEHLSLNISNLILQDKRVRQALALAIDKDALSEKIYHGLWKPAYSDQTPLLWAFNPKVKTALPYDVKKARLLLEEAGWKDTDGDGIRERNGQKLQLEICTTAGRPNRERTEVVLQQYFKQIGVNLKIKNYNASLLFGNYDDGGILATGKYEIAMYAWVAAPDPDNYTLWSSKQIPPEGQNVTRFVNSRIDELTEAGTRTVDRNERKKIYYEIQEILTEEVPVIPLLYWANIDPHTERLLNFKTNPSAQGNTWNCWEWKFR